MRGRTRLPQGPQDDTDLSRIYTEVDSEVIAEVVDRGLQFPE